MNRKRNRNDKKKDITLMTLLANESTSDSRKLLKKYGKEDAKDHVDLEKKLEQLYYSTDDKLQLEKEMAEMHPHKKWLFRTLQPTVEMKQEIKEETSGADDSCSCCSKKSNASTNSSFDGLEKQPTTIVLEDKRSSDNNNIPMSMIALVAVIGITFYALKTMK
jgi:hypothetical protein